LHDQQQLLLSGQLFRDSSGGQRLLHVSPLKWSFSTLSNFRPRNRVMLPFCLLRCWWSRSLGEALSVEEYLRAIMLHNTFPLIQTHVCNPICRVQRTAGCWCTPCLELGGQSEGEGEGGMLGPWARGGLT